MKRLMNWMVLSCKKATLLIEKGHYERLSFTCRIQLRIHLKICEKCSDYKKQSFLIENALKANSKSLLNLSGLKLSDPARSRIQKEIDNKLNKI